jgi:hypothetical protein
MADTITKDTKITLKLAGKIAAVLIMAGIAWGALYTKVHYIEQEVNDLALSVQKIHELLVPKIVSK